jgi:uncharacterized protein YgbK (DUF1537 family)
VAPAYPEFKRVTVDGLHLVDGVPVSSTESGRDPRRPVLDSRLATVVGEGHDLKVVALELALVRRGSEAVAVRLGELLDSSEGFIVAADAETDRDLEVLAQASLGFREKLLLAGSGGLAQALADPKNLPRTPAGPPPSASALGTTDAPKRPAVFFGGSSLESLRRQLDLLADLTGGALITLDVESLLNGWELLLPAAEPGRPLIVNLPPPDYAPDGGEIHSSLEIIRAFGRMAAGVVRTQAPRTVFLSGGDTAREVLRALAVEELWIRSEICPGVVFLSAGPLSVLTKSGGFGSSDLLTELWSKIEA